MLQTGAVPTASDTVQVSGPDGAGYQYVTINNGTNALCDDLSFGVDGGAGGNLTVETGGTLTVGDIMAMARVPGMGSELNLNGGTITIGNKFRMDVDGSTLNMTGGLLDITNSFDMDAGSSDAGGGTVNMYGGLIKIGSILDMDQRGGTVNLYGGTMEMAGDVDMVAGGRGSGIVNIYGDGQALDPSGAPTVGGTLIIGDDLEMGDIDAMVNMYGGTMIIKSLFKMNSSNSGTFNLIDGTVTAEEGQGLLMEGGLIDIESGTLILPGDVVSIVDGFIGNGWITAYGGIGDVMVDTTTNPGMTTVYGVVPEPATMFLLGLGGLLLRRRRKA